MASVSADSFVSLHTHSHHSPLDGFSTIEEYVMKAASLNQRALGISDHGNVQGIYNLVRTAKKHGITPVPGCEFYMAPENPEGAKVRRKIFYGPNGEKAPDYDVSANGSYLHQTIWAVNQKGLENLFKLSSMSYQVEHYLTKPRIDIDMLAQHNEGLVVATGCPSSEISTRFLLGQDRKAYEYAGRLKEIFGERLYVEIMQHDLKDPLERALIPRQLELSKKMGIPLLATNDSHYAEKGDAPHHENILCAQSGSTMTEPPMHEGGRRFAFDGSEFYMKTAEEMHRLFPEHDFPHALKSSVEIAEMATDISIDFNPALRPKIDIPEGHTEASYLKSLIREGYETKRGNDSPEVREESQRRVNKEWNVISSEGFIGYFLVVWDYINWARKNDVGVGVGRGSIGGSEIAYLLDISRTCPIRWNLMFERFLSEGRGATYQLEYSDDSREEIYVSHTKPTDQGDKYIHQLSIGDVVTEDDTEKTITKTTVIDPGSMPDVDTDFHTEGREEVLEYITEKYGESSVSNIITFGTFKAKTAFKQMCTMYEKNFQSSNKITSLIPGPVEGVEMSLSDIFNPEHKRYEEAVDFRDAVNDDSWHDIIDGAMRLQGKIKSTGVHACGVLMSSLPLEGILPTHVRQDDQRVISQWKYEDCEEIGLIKMDLLGLDTIDLIEKTRDYIRDSGKKVPDMQEIIDGDMQDKKTLKLLQLGLTTGVFQLGKAEGVKDLLRRIKPTSIEDIIATTAMYRPGPMGMNSHTKYADRKNEREEVDYIHDDFKGTVMEEILSNTYGLIVFQEQILQIANKIGGLTLQEGDKLRKAMGKKKKDVMDSMKPKFFEGGMKKGYSEEALEALWTTMEPFASYAFNRAHSASYAITAYLTAYLKANYPVEFIAASIAQKIGDNNKKQEALELFKEARRMKIKIGTVDANSSDIMVAPSKDPESPYDIVLGFSGVKSVSMDNAEKIITEREQNGRYRSAIDFIKRNSKNGLSNKTLYQNLALAGTFDTLGASRKSVVDNVVAVLDSEKVTQKKGMNLFDTSGVDIEESTAITIDSDDEYGYQEMLKKEADMIRRYLSAHPLDRAGDGLKASGKTDISTILDEENPLSLSYRNTKLRIIAAVTEMSAKVSRSGKKAYTLTVDDGTGYADIYATGDMAQAFVKHNVITQAETKKQKEGLKNLPLSEFMNKDQLSLYRNEFIPAVPEPVTNDIYILECNVSSRYGELKISLEDIIPLHMDYYGRLPVRLRVKKSWFRKEGTLERFKRILKELSTEHPGDYELWLSQVGDEYSMADLTAGRELPLEYKDTKLRVDGSKRFMQKMEQKFTVDMVDRGITPLPMDIA